MEPLSRLTKSLETCADRVGRTLGSPRGFATIFQLFLLEGLVSVPTMFAMYVVTHLHCRSDFVLLCLLPVMLTSARSCVVAFGFLSGPHAETFNVVGEYPIGKVLSWSYPSTSLALAGLQVFGANSVLRGDTLAGTPRTFLSIGFAWLILANLALGAASVISFRWALKEHGQRQLATRTFPALFVASASVESLTLRTFKIGDGVGGEEAHPRLDSAPTCSICLTEYQPEDLAKEMYCGHVFHGACIDTWLRPGNVRRCPMRCKLPSRCEPGPVDAERSSSLVRSAVLARSVATPEAVPRSSVTDVTLEPPV